ncbi:MAG: ribosome biogenesis GTP-binding protein YihA/YsxC, partial [Eubacteriales bacterium]|nr:ribosome biogenesis GTP-binding protein YihA/YsxC [Eubacteriales bacterium]
LLNRKQFARVGATPGKTVHVNYFLIDGRLYLIDLPGYGFARVPQSEKERWARLMESFFADTEACDLGVLIVDARHRPTEADRQMADWYRGSGMDFLVAANKMDKLKKSEREGQLQLVRETLALGEGTDVIPFSAESGEGREALLRGILNRL